MCNELSNSPTICGGDKAAEVPVMTWQKRLNTGFNQVHTGLNNIRSAIEEVREEVDDGGAMTLVKEMEFGALAPMRKLRQLYGIGYDWSEES